MRKAWTTIPTSEGPLDIYLAYDHGDSRPLKLPQSIGKDLTAASTSESVYADPLSFDLPTTHPITCQLRLIPSEISLGFFLEVQIDQTVLRKELKAVQDGNRVTFDILRETKRKVRKEPQEQSLDHSIAGRTQTKHTAQRKRNRSESGSKILGSRSLKRQKQCGDDKSHHTDSARSTRRCITVSPAVQLEPQRVDDNGKRTPDVSRTYELSRNPQLDTKVDQGRRLDNTSNDGLGANAKSQRPCNKPHVLAHLPQQPVISCARGRPSEQFATINSSFSKRAPTGRFTTYLDLIEDMTVASDESCVCWQSIVMQ